MTKEEILHKEIDLLQAVITRMANNSFLLKGWIVSLIAVLLALTKDTIVATQLSYFCVILLIPVFVFWYLDAFFLHKERCYIKLYEWVISNRQTSNDFLYDLNYRRFENKVDSIWKIMRSDTLGLFYGFIVLILIGLGIHNLIIN
ncbi:hypothetical protein JE945_002408 [Flavobacterium psychrophilum]|uniref:Uncharacterized protein n=1 Tax=Flavobacterium psychrophilum TaxID=96345 RepID=A0A7U2RAD8_FLAPS|nr:hypothetical protein [Flavobacterium psychrophilum]EKT4553219.1 hypothetical protein [Flavobacterium psychrophilum]QRE04895.1 hypothetical protein H0H26_04715 [Flavobacterium psychrophilum]